MCVGGLGDIGPFISFHSAESSEPLRPPDDGASLLVAEGGREQPTRALSKIHSPPCHVLPTLPVIVLTKRCFYAPPPPLPPPPPLQCCAQPGGSCRHDGGRPRTQRRPMLLPE